MTNSADKYTMSLNDLPIEIVDRETGITLGVLETTYTRASDLPGGALCLRAKPRGLPSRYFVHTWPSDLDRALYWLESQITGLDLHL